MQDPRVDIAAEVVGAEWMLETRRLKRVPGFLFDRIVGGYPGRQQRGGHQDGQDCPADDQITTSQQLPADASPPSSSVLNGRQRIGNDNIGGRHVRGSSYGHPATPIAR